MKIVYLGYERKLGLGSEHELLYLDGDMIHDENIDDMVQKIESFKPDLLLEREFNDGKAIFTSLYKRLPTIPKAWWCVDLHCNLIHHVVYAKQFDFVFCGQSWFIPLLKNQVKAKLFYLPLCHTQTLTEYQEWLAKPKPERTIELSFVGNIRSIHVDRNDYVVDFMKHMGDTFVAANQSYDLMLETLSKSKATFNCSLNDDLNFRVWEALATNTPLITDYVPDLEHVRNLKRYITRIYPRKTEKRLLKALDQTHLNSTDFILKEHTITSRVNQLLWMLGSETQYVF